MKNALKPAFSAWIITWAVVTFASAAVETGPIETGFLAWLSAWFNTADAVPPMAKIVFGATLAISLFILEKLRLSQWRFLIAYIALTIGAFLLATIVLPLNYYESFSSASFWPYHAVSAGLGAVIGNFLRVKAQANRDPA